MEHPKRTTASSLEIAYVLQRPGIALRLGIWFTWKLPIGSMYGNFYLHLVDFCGVGKYTIHGSYGIFSNVHLLNFGAVYMYQILQKMSCLGVAVLVQYSIWKSIPFSLFFLPGCVLPRYVAGRNSHQQFAKCVMPSCHTFATHVGIL